VLIKLNSGSTQPETNARPGDYWLQRKLVYAQLGGPNLRDCVKGLRPPAFATSSITGSQGARARRYTEPHYIDTGYSGHSTYRTYVARTLRVGLGANGFGRIFDKFASSVSSESLLNISTTATQYSRVYSGGQADWQWAQPAANVWVTICLSYDSSSAANAPIVYMNGQKYSVTNTASSSGTPVITSENYCIGNRRVDDARGWDGELSDFYIFDSILNQAELRALSINPWQIFAPPPRRIWSAPAGGANIYTLSVSGGVVLSGTIPLRRERRQVPSGGMQFSGTVALRRERRFVPSGTINFSGTAPIVFNAPNIYTIIPSGGTALSGTAAFRRTRLLSAGGTVNFSGTVSLLRTRLLAPTGQVTFQGSAGIIFIPAGGLPYVPSSRITIGAARSTRIS
jgi:hypothetical protein